MSVVCLLSFIRCSDPAGCGSCPSCMFGGIHVMYKLQVWLCGGCSGCVGSAQFTSTITESELNT